MSAANNADRALKRAYAAGALRDRHVEETIFALTVPETEVVADDARLPAVTGSVPEIVNGTAPSELAHSGVAHAPSSDALETHATSYANGHDHAVRRLHRNWHGLYRRSQRQRESDNDNSNHAQSPI